MLSDALASSPILRAEDGTALAPVGTGFEFGIDPSEDPELAMVSHHLGMGRGGTIYTHDTLGGGRYCSNLCTEMGAGYARSGVQVRSAPSALCNVGSEKALEGDVMQTLDGGWP